MVDKLNFALFNVRRYIWQKEIALGRKKRPSFDWNGEKKYYSFYGTEITSLREGNILIKHLLELDEPCFIGRIGTVEMGVLSDAIAKEYHLKSSIKQSSKKVLCNNAGFFPENPADEDIMKWANIYKESIKLLDVHASFDTHSEDYVASKFCPNARITQLCALEPYYFDSPWSHALLGKKVLVVHPFESTIKNQFINRTKLFKNPEVLPEFELKTVKAVLSLAGEETPFSTWFDALDYMKCEINKIDFDIAILGCGAYGIPLGGYIKSMGKKAIIMGGATQLLFGIVGARWEKTGVMNQYINEYWVHPSASETPKHSGKVENACYW